MFMQYLPGLENVVKRFQAAMTAVDMSMFRHVQQNAVRRTAVFGTPL
jgi:hypothetical protein